MLKARQAGARPGYGERLGRRGAWASFSRSLLIALAALLFASASSPLLAKGFDSSKYAAVVMDPESGYVAFSRRADSQRYPASLTKLMTLYELFEALEDGRLSLNDTIPISANAARQPPSRLGLSAGSRIKVEDAILALIVQSANDVAVAVAETLGGSERGFAKQMTDQARALGMTRTVYRNASGLPNPGQITTARDLAILARALITDFPQYYGYFATETLTFGGHTYKTHNHLLGKVDGVDGMKTGYTRASGFNLVTSAQREGQRLIAVVLGGPSAGERDQHMRELVQKNFTVLAERGPASGEWPVAEAPTPRPKPVLTASLEPPASMSRAGPARKWPGLPVPKPLSDGSAMDTVAAYMAPASGSAVGEAQGSGEETGAGIGDLIAPPAMAGTQGDTASPDASQRWGIQIGAYMSPTAAETRLENARAAVPQLLANTPWAVIPVTTDGAVFYRARFGPFTEEEATEACEALGPYGFKCFKVPPEDLAALEGGTPEGAVP